MDIFFGHRDKGDITDLYYYKDDQLIGYMGVFPIYQKNTVRILGMVHPFHRLNGVFTRLMKTAMTKLNHIETFHLYTESESGNAFLRKMNANYLYSTYKMKYEIEHELEIKAIDGITITEPLMDDLEQIVQIGMEAFETSYEEEKPLAELNIRDQSRFLRIAKMNGRIIGTVLSTIEDQQAVVGDLAVRKEYRKKGIGKHLLQTTLKDLKFKGIEDIYLNVETENDHALKLYLLSGFKILKSTNVYEQKF